MTRAASLLAVLMAATGGIAITAAAPLQHGPAGHAPAPRVAAPAPRAAPVHVSAPRISAPQIRAAAPRAAAPQMHAGAGRAAAMAHAAPRVGHGVARTAVAPHAASRGLQHRVAGHAGPGRGAAARLAGHRATSAGDAGRTARRHAQGGPSAPHGRNATARQAAFARAQAATHAPAGPPHGAVRAGADNGRIGRHTQGQPMAGRQQAAAAERVRLAHGWHHGRHDWRRFRRGDVGWAGPVFWPYAYADVIDYTFSPYDYEAAYDYPLWAYGYDDVFAGVLPPYGDTGAGRAGTRSQRSGRRGGSPARAETGSENPPAPESLARLCGAPDPDALDLPIRRIAQVVGPDSGQQAKLEALKGAEARAAEVLKVACPAKMPASPLERLDLVELRLKAVLQAIDIVRPALEEFYAALTDEQKARFNQMGAPPQAGRKSAGYASTAAPPACGVEAPAFPADRVAQLVRPHEAQRVALRELAEAATRAAEKVRAACPPQTPLTPVGRLDAVRARVQAMLEATAIVRPALEKFYGSLDDAQKARFNQMTEQQASAG